MKNVAKNEPVFHETTFTTIKRKGQIWFTASDLAAALRYANVKSITNLYNQNFDEFSPGMSQVIESVTSGNYRKRVRIFSLRGAHLLAMFARTPVAKEFRRWVLDILDRESGSKRLPAKAPATVQVLCPCCGQTASILTVKKLHRHCVEIVSTCCRGQCPIQPFKTVMSFSHYLEKAAHKTLNQASVSRVINGLNPIQREALVRLLQSGA